MLTKEEETCGNLKLYWELVTYMTFIAWWQIVTVGLCIIGTPTCYSVYPSVSVCSSGSRIHRIPHNLLHVFSTPFWFSLYWDSCDDAGLDYINFALLLFICLLNHVYSVTVNKISGKKCTTVHTMTMTVVLSILRHWFISSPMVSYGIVRWVRLQRQKSQVSNRIYNYCVYCCSVLVPCTDINTDVNNS